MLAVYLAAQERSSGRSLSWRLSVWLATKATGVTAIGRGSVGLSAAGNRDDTSSHIRFLFPLSACRHHTKRPTSMLPNTFYSSQLLPSFRDCGQRELNAVPCRGSPLRRDVMEEAGYGGGAGCGADPGLRGPTPGDPLRSRRSPQPLS